MKHQINLKLTVCEKVCKECPFRKNSLKGWLGNHTTESINDAINKELLFSCHLQRKEKLDVNIKEVQTGKQSICRGFILCSSNSVKMFGQNPISGNELRRLQKEVEESENYQKERKQILNKWDFVKHHKIEKT